MQQKTITIDWAHRIFFARSVFGPEHNLLAQSLLGRAPGGAPTAVLVLLDSHVAAAHPELEAQIAQYARRNAAVMRLAGLQILPGGEVCKNDFTLVTRAWQAINDAGLDRHSQVWIIGGGAVLDLGCFAAATAHRGIRHVRFPTTTLSQGDGGVGVKNGVNFFGKKNWVGSFAVPHAVVNDFSFLLSLPPAARRDGAAHGIAWVGTWNGLPSNPINALPAEKFRLGGMVLCRRASSTLISPATPAAVSVWPIFVFTEPKAQNPTRSVR